VHGQAQAGAGPPAEGQPDTDAGHPDPSGDPRGELSDEATFPDQTVPISLTNCRPSFLLQA